MGRIIGVITVFVLGITITVTPTISYGTNEEAVVMVKKAIELIKADGKDTAFLQINNPEGEFKGREFYMLIYDFNGTCLAHSGSKDMIGRNLLDSKGADGREFIRETVEMMGKQSSGWKNYKYIDLPLSIRIKQKNMYMERYEDIIVAYIINK